MIRDQRFSVFANRIARPFTHRFRSLFAAVLLGVVACSGPSSDAEAVRRGDAAFAQGKYAEALSEYRLALRQGDDAADTWLRTAHAFARVNRINEAQEHYLAAIARDSTLQPQAAADLLRVARRAIERRDGLVASAAVDAAIRVQPGVSLSGVSLDLARFYVRNAQLAEAISHFQRAFADSGDDPEILLEMAMAYEQLGDCERALAFFDQVRPRIAPGRREEVDWQIGNCSFQLARDAQERGFSDEALRLYRVIQTLGEPRNLVSLAWFESAEILSRRGECASAVTAYERVVSEDGGAGGLAARARDRVDQIRFRPGGEGPC